MMPRTDRDRRFPGPRFSAWVAMALSLLVAGSALARPDEKKNEWVTTEKLLLSAEDAKQAAVWVSEDGQQVAYIKPEKGKKCLVVNGKAGKLYDEIMACRQGPFDIHGAIFFGGGKHFA